MFSKTILIYTFFSDVNDDSVIHAVKLLYPKLEHQLLLAKQVALIEPLKAHYIYLDSKLLVPVACSAGFKPSSFRQICGLSNLTSHFTIYVTSHFSM